MTEQTRLQALDIAIRAGEQLDNHEDTQGFLKVVHEVDQFLVRGTLPNPVQLHAIDSPIIKRMVGVYDLIANDRLADATGGPTVEVSLSQHTGTITYVRVAGRVIDETSDEYDGLSFAAVRGLVSAGAVAILKSTPTTEDDDTDWHGLAVRRHDPAD